MSARQERGKVRAVDELMELLRAHRSSFQAECVNAKGLPCGFKPTRRGSKSLGQQHDDHVAELVADWLTKHDAEVGAKALRDAADAYGHYAQANGAEAINWLRTRASTIARATATTEVGTDG